MTPHTRKYHREYKSERYALLRDAGLCPRCKGDPVPGRTYCRACLDRKAEEKRNQHATPTPAQRKQRRKSNAAWMRAKRRRLKREGLCVDCGGAIDTRLTRCKRCRDALAARQKRPMPEPRLCGYCRQPGHNRQKCEKPEADKLAADEAMRPLLLLQYAGSRVAA